MRKIIYAGIFLFFILIDSVNVLCQVTLNGPTCVIAGAIYQYNISGSWDTASTMRVCLTGGIFKSQDTSFESCTQKNGMPLGSVLVQWKDSLNTASIILTSTLGEATLNVSIISPLVPGIIDSSSKNQSIAYDSIPSVIVCSTDNGGSCSPSYSHQWQQSSNGMSWVNIEGATDQNLKITSPLTQSTYYRRKVTEQQSGTIGYSDIALVDVGPQPTGFKNNRQASNYFTFCMRIENNKTF